MIQANVGWLELLYHAQEGREFRGVLCGRHDVRCEADPEVLGLKIKAMGCRGGGCAASQRQLEHGRFAAHGCVLAGVGSLEMV
jgi:hypothetical protein